MTAEKLLESTIEEYNKSVSDFHKFKFTESEKALFVQMMQVFAGHHVVKSLNSAANEVWGGPVGKDYVINKGSIINSYPLEKII
jgi:hypothetical protein